MVSLTMGGAKRVGGLSADSSVNVPGTFEGDRLKVGGIKKFTACGTGDSHPGGDRHGEE